jgi:hypothetical protein
MRQRRHVAFLAVAVKWQPTLWRPVAGLLA